MQDSENKIQVKRVSAPRGKVKKIISYMKMRLRVPDEIVSLIRGMHPNLKKRVRAAFSEILNDPFCGKALKEDLAGLRSFRIKRFRIIYKISSKREISLVALGPRKYIYEETFRIIQKRKKP